MTHTHPPDFILELIASNIVWMNQVVSLIWVLRARCHDNPQSISHDGDLSPKDGTMLFWVGVLLMWSRWSEWVIHNRLERFRLELRLKPTSPLIHMTELNSTLLFKVL